jgi:hypothetical protein
MSGLQSGGWACDDGELIELGVAAGAELARTAFVAVDSKRRVGVAGDGWMKLALGVDQRERAVVVPAA